ncbi:MAG: pyridoxal-phosphate dependent enzyme, partial [Chloroflexi bacterium]|nr:pyridoxal-phosphate dependent enzyme [Chloroflexota bacterium]
MNSTLTHLECTACGARHSADELQNVCRQCGKVLYARYDLVEARKTLTKESLRARLATLWRYAELLPVRRPENVLSLGEGFTPLLSLPRIGAELGLTHLYVKEEGLNPTGSFKARGLSVAVSKAKELGATTLAIPTAGNAGGALAAYAARGGLTAHVVMPKDAPAANQLETSYYGA